MIATPFEYERAASIDDAVAKLAAANGTAKLLAGGHSLMPLMKLRLSEPARLIDIARIPELRGIDLIDGAISIGAATTHDDIARSALLRDSCPVVADAAAAIGDQQVRNRGTIGGSLAHADPSADYPAVMLALDAELRLAGSRGRRTVRATEFFRDLFTVDLEAGEILTAISFRPVRSAAYAKLYQRASHYALVGVAAAVHLDHDRIVSAGIGLTGAAPSARRLTAAEEALAGRPATTDTIEAAANLAGRGLDDVNGDLHASAEYRRAMVTVFTRRALAEAVRRH